MAHASSASMSSHSYWSPQRSSMGTLLCCLALIAVVLAVYNPVIHNSFVNYDDEGYIVQNAHVRAGLTGDTVKWAFTTYDQSNWHPLTWLSHALDCEIFGLNPAGHHYTSVLLHAANAVLLFLLLQSATGFRWRSLMVAALFALHPINVESVAWAAERKNVLSMMFFLLALYAYTWYGRRPDVRRYAVVTVAFALALMSKPQVVTFPFLLLLWDYWPLRRIGAGFDEASAALTPKLSIGWLLLEKLPWLALAVASSFITMKAQRAGGTVKALSLYSLPLRIETSVIAYARYLGKAFWPANLVALYPHPTKLYPAWQVAASGVLLLLITVGVVVLRKRRYLAVGWLWFLGSLVPMIGVVQVGAQAMADRYAYIPFIGLFLMVTWLAADLAAGVRDRRGLPPAWMIVPSAACLIALGAVTYHQVTYWHDTESFWRRTIELTEDNYLAHDILGYYLTTQGRAEEGSAEFRNALAIRPEDPEANISLGPYEEAHGNLAAAIEHYQKVALYSANPALRTTAYFDLGHAYRRTGDLPRAKQYFEWTLQMAPNEETAMVGLGLIAEANGDFAEAVREYSRAQAVKPDDLVCSILLADALQHAGRTGDAKAILDRARTSPNFSEAQKIAAMLLAGK
ncbi:MAG: tetratricopeptide repeat protein [Terriglobales bacterium]